jgi:hypothetical protein
MSSRRLPRDTSLSCPVCGWRSKVTTAGLASKALRNHPCEKNLAAAEATLRYQKRMAAVDRTPKVCQHHTTHRHGTYAAYVMDLCRCLLCARARSDWQETTNRTKAYGTWNGLVDAEPARQHVRALQAAGLGLKQISAAAGFAGGVMGKLMYGYHGRPPAVRVRPTTANRIMAVPMPTIANLAAAQLVPAIGTARRIQALMRVGWTIPKIAQLTGVEKQSIRRAARGEQQKVLAATHRAVQRTYDEIWNRPAPADTREARSSASRARSMAIREGWPPPAAWDDDAIDVADAAPADSDDARLTVDELVGEVLHIKESTTDLAMVASRLGMTRAALDVALRRAGRGDLLRVAS